MKLLHTANLLIGSGCEENSQQKTDTILTGIVNMVQKEKADAVLLTGDIFNTAEPASADISMFEAFLNELTEQKTTLILISGERDAGAFAVFTDKFTEKQGIYIAEGYAGSLKRVFLKDEWGAVDFVCMPFVRNVPISMEQRLASTPMPLDLMSRHVLLTHCIVTEENGKLPELMQGESMEELEKIPASWLTAFDYVALGHTNKRQRMGNREVWYPGALSSPMEIEAAGPGSVNLVRLGRKGDIAVEAAELSI